MSARTKLLPNSRVRNCLQSLGRPASSVTFACFCPTVSQPGMTGPRRAWGRASEESFDADVHSGPSTSNSELGRQKGPTEVRRCPAPSPEFVGLGTTARDSATSPCLDPFYHSCGVASGVASRQMRWRPSVARTDAAPSSSNVAQTAWGNAARSRFRAHAALPTKDSGYRYLPRHAAAHPSSGFVPNSGTPVPRRMRKTSAGLGTYAPANSLCGTCSIG